MKNNFYNDISIQLDDIKKEGLYKSEREITTSQSEHINTSKHNDIINMCANNYLGLANNSELISNGKKILDSYGYGMASVRFICGTQNIHKQLEQKLSDFLCMEETILFSSCFDANTGLFETLLTAEDAIISDELNHASIIDGIRLCKAKRFRYKNNNLADLEEKLIEAKESGARHIMIATDGVFSMDGIIANLKGICDLAEKYGAILMVDDSHSVGFMGENGRGTHEFCDVIDRVDIITGTLGKALGGASGGYVAAKKEIVELLRQRSRPYLFSNSLAPIIVGNSLKVLELIENSPELITKLKNNADYFRKEMTKKGFDLAGNGHAIIPVMVGDAKLAKELSDKLLTRGIYVIGFSFPVVPRGKARIRTQISALHTKEQLDKAIIAFTEISKELGII